MSMMGNVKLLFTAVSHLRRSSWSCCSRRSPCRMSARERVTEIAVLKAIGFEQRLILTLMLTEFASLTLLGGLIGTRSARSRSIAPSMQAPRRRDSSRTFPSIRRPRRSASSSRFLSASSPADFPRCAHRASRSSTASGGWSKEQ